MIRAIIASLLFSPVVIVAAECEQSPNQLGAVYERVVQRGDKASGNTQSMVLWRYGRQVLREYPDTGMAELWTLTDSDRLYVARYFDADQRGIEYQPGDIRSGNGTSTWQAQRELIPAQLRASLQPSGTVSGTGCERTQLLEGATANDSNRLEWRTAQELPQAWEQRHADTAVRWRLKDIITDPGRVVSEFSKRENYGMTDYADIGDNETDPFFQRMMTLGFIAHGASGFYDQNGRPLPGHQH